jgi:hypothetical protein
MMTTGQILNLLFIFIAIVCGVYGITSIIIRTVGRKMKEEADRIETDILNKLKGYGLNNANR